MNLIEKLTTVPLREIAGSLAGNRFQYQYHWAMLKILELFEERDDFLVFFEFCDDIIVLDCSENPSYIDFYQIKTNDKNNVFYWLVKDLTNQGTAKKRKVSIMEKIIDNYVRYEGNVKTLHIVSNLHFKLGDNNTTVSNPLVLGELNDSSINEFKKVMCTNCKQGNCAEECRKIVHFDYSSLSIESFRDSCIGKLSNFLDKHCKSHSVHERALYSVLIRDIEKKSTLEKCINNPDDLIKLKSISKKQFKEQLQDIEKSSIVRNNWNLIHTDISKIYSILETHKIRKSFDQLIIDILNIENIVLHEIIEFVKSCLDYKLQFTTGDNDSFKIMIDEIIAEIRSEKKISSFVYDDYYLKAIIVREFNSYE